MELEVNSDDTAMSMLRQMCKFTLQEEKGTSRRILLTGTSQFGDWEGLLRCCGCTQVKIMLLDETLSSVGWTSQEDLLGWR